MDAVLLIDGHFILFELEIGDALLQNARQQVMRELVLVGESGSSDGLDTPQKALVRFMVLRDSIERVVIELVVIAVVAEGRGALGEIAQFGLVVVVEDSILRGNAVPCGFCVLAGNGYRNGEQENQT